MSRALLLEPQPNAAGHCRPGKLLKPGISHRHLNRPEVADFLRDEPPMRGPTGGRGLYRQTEASDATQRSPTGGNTHGDRGPIVVSGRESRPHGKGDQDTGFKTARGFRMEDPALTRLEAIRNQRKSVSGEPDALKGARPVREGLHLDRLFERTSMAR